MEFGLVSLITSVSLNLCITTLPPDKYLSQYPTYPPPFLPRDGLRVFEIFFRIIHDWNTRLRFSCHLFHGISKIFLSLGKLLLDQLDLLVRIY